MYLALFGAVFLRMAIMRLFTLTVHGAFYAETSPGALASWSSGKREERNLTFFVFVRGRGGV